MSRISITKSILVIISTMILLLSFSSIAYSDDRKINNFSPPTPADWDPVIQAFVRYICFEEFGSEGSAGCGWRQWECRIEPDTEDMHCSWGSDPYYEEPTDY